MVMGKDEQQAVRTGPAQRPRTGFIRWVSGRRPDRFAAERRRRAGAAHTALLHDIGMGGTAASAANAILAKLAGTPR